MSSLHSNEVPAVEEEEKDEDGGFTAYSPQDEVILSIKPIAKLPMQRVRLSDPNGLAALNAQQLASDLVSRSMRLAGRSVQITFDPKIREGLKIGTLKIMSARGGGERAIAVDAVNSRIAGHARIKTAVGMQVGPVIFEIVSMAVGQAHLAEINKNLMHIRQGIEDLRAISKDEQLSEIFGSLTYLKDMAANVFCLQDSRELLAPKLQQLESTKLQLHRWLHRLKTEASRHRTTIATQKDEDTFGTGSAYSKLISV